MTDMHIIVAESMVILARVIKLLSPLARIATAKKGPAIPAKPWVTPDIAPSMKLAFAENKEVIFDCWDITKTANKTNNDIMIFKIFGFINTNKKVPNGTNKMNAINIGKIVFFLALFKAIGNNPIDTGISIKISIATAWTGPKIIAKAGIANKADPNPE